MIGTLHATRRAITFARGTAAIEIDALLGARRREDDVIEMIDHE
jgi:hypothetical protein